MNATMSFSDQIFNFILTQYGKSVLEKIKQETNRTVVNRLVSSSSQENYSVERAANKIVAMLRLNP
jgi:tRNA isopentenyl-2-thiomethyl-A-37 hydroxylase MiaE